MADRADITPELLRQLLSYEPETGKLFWNERDTKLFRESDRVSDLAIKMWNAKNTGREVGSISRDGYITTHIFRVPFRLHRVAWAIHYGAWPVHQIDHINGIRTDNRITNLRDVQGFENNRNRAKPPNNTSGHIGVIWHKMARKWCAQINAAGHNYHLGLFDDLKDAIEARRLAEKKMGFHPNHGR